MDLIPYSRQSIIKEDISMIEKVMESDFLTQGPKVPDFEEELNCVFESIEVNGDMTLRQVADRLDMSYVRVKQIQDNVMNKISKMFQ